MRRIMCINMVGLMKREGWYVRDCIIGDVMMMEIKIEDRTSIGHFQKHDLSSTNFQIITLYHNPSLFINYLVSNQRNFQLNAKRNWKMNVQIEKVNCPQYFLILICSSLLVNCFTFFLHLSKWYFKLLYVSFYKCKNYKII